MDKKEKSLSKRQQRFLKAFQESGGNISLACINAKIARRTYYTWLDNTEFKNEVDDIVESTVDYVESKLMRQIQLDNLTAIIFYLKTKGKSRGYIETIENQVSVNPFEELMKSLPDE